MFKFNQKFIPIILIVGIISLSGLLYFWITYGNIKTKLLPDCALEVKYKDYNVTADERLESGLSNFSIQHIRNSDNNTEFNEVIILCSPELIPNQFLPKDFNIQNVNGYIIGDNSKFIPPILFELKQSDEIENLQMYFNSKGTFDDYQKTSIYQFSHNKKNYLITETYTLTGDADMHTTKAVKLWLNFVK